MSETTKITPVVYGFIRIIQVPELGHCGGFLLVNALGRPIEFHCTAPVNENRAQQILYGQTYGSYLQCDQIGKALLDKSKNRPELILVDDASLRDLGQLGSTPIVHVARKDASNLATTDESNLTPAFEIGAFRLTCLAGPSEIGPLKANCQALASSIPLDEPFERIGQAIDEAQAVVR